MDIFSLSLLDFNRYISLINWCNSKKYYTLLPHDLNFMHLAYEELLKHLT